MPSCLTARVRWSLLAGILVVSCAHAPPQLSPAGAQAFANTRAIQALDLLRDTAIAAQAQQPPLLALPLTRRIVMYHQSALRIIRAAPVGWKAVVLAGLDEVQADVPASARSLLAPYIALVRAAIHEGGP